MSPIAYVSMASAVLLLLGSFGGAGQPLDLATIRFFADWRAAHPSATQGVILLTHLGGAPMLLSLAIAGASWLWWRGLRGRAAALMLTVLGGRLGVELVKLAVDRPRPALDLHPVAVFSQSFPSAHAGNSMITYLAIALFVAPERWRRAAVGGALLLALAIGATRAVLGVHWPSDVIAGWIFGAALVSLCQPRSAA